jgi:hypothetical protein
LIGNDNSDSKKTGSGDFLQLQRFRRRRRRRFGDSDGASDMFVIVMLRCIFEFDFAYFDGVFDWSPSEMIADVFFLSYMNRLSSF